MKTTLDRRTRATALMVTLGALGLVALFEASPAEARRGGGFRGRGFSGARIGFATPFYGYHSPYYSFYGSYGYPHRYGPYRGQEGGMNPVQARLMGWGAIDVHVKPGKAEVWVNGKFVGTARDFDGLPTYLWLEEGEHRVTIYRGGFETYDENISITPGEVIKLKLKLAPGESQPPEPSPQAAPASSRQPAPKA